jgi:hypothetical protein
LDRFPELVFNTVYEEIVVSIPWREWRSIGDVQIPSSGEPEDYFVEYPRNTNRSGRISQDLFHLKPTIEVACLQKLHWWKNIGSPVSIVGPVPDSPFFQLVKNLGSGYGPLICCDRFKSIVEEVLDVIELEEVQIEVC